MFGADLLVCCSAAALIGLLFGMFAIIGQSPSSIWPRFILDDGPVAISVFGLTTTIGAVIGLIVGLSRVSVKSPPRRVKALSIIVVSAITALLVAPPSIHSWRLFIQPLVGASVGGLAILVLGVRRSRTQS